MKHILLTLILLASPLSHANEKMNSSNNLSFDEKVVAFTKIVNDSPLAYKLSSDAFLTAWQKNGLDSTMRAQLNRSELNIVGPESSKDKLERIVVEERISALADQIVAELLKKPIQEINITILSWLRNFIIKPELRLAHSLLFDSIGRYKFSSYEIKRLAEESSRLHQFSQGSFYAGAAVTLAAIITPTRLWPKLKDFVMRSKKSTIPLQIPEQQSRLVSDELTVDDALRLLTQLNIGTKPNISLDAAKIATHMTHGRFYNAATKIKSSYVFKSYLSVLGIAAFGGASNVGWHALSDILYEKDHTNTLFNPAELRDDFYNGIAVLKLSCDSFDLLNKTAQANKGQLREYAIQLNQLFSEYTLLTDIAPQLIQPSILPTGISANNGQIQMDLKIKGKNENFAFNCSRFANLKVDKIEVSLLFALNDLTQTFANLKKIEEAQKQGAANE